MYRQSPRDSKYIGFLANLLVEQGVDPASESFRFRV